MKRLLILIVVLFQVQLVQAQNLRIVKDNVNCSYGLKNQKGEWVFEPLYTLIQEYNSGYFLVKDVEGDGLLSPEGKWIVKCKYDRLYPIKPNWPVMGAYPQGRCYHPRSVGFFFMGEIDDRRFLLNSQGKKSGRTITWSNIEV